MTPGRILAAGLLMGIGLLGSPAWAATPPEPDGYRMDDYRAPTPATLAGARVLDDAAAAEAWRSKAAVFVDVLPHPPKPANLPPGTLWRDPPHESVPGAVWLPNVGFGALAPETDAYFRRGLEAATGGDRAKPIVVFCKRDCWMSWNAARRALSYGYRQVWWYPDGIDGWSEAGLPAATVAPFE